MAAVICRVLDSPTDMEVTRKPHLHTDWIDPHAYGIVKALQKNDFETYLVGGCVRDLLLNIHPKDYDIATMAHPPQVKRLIYMSFIIGKRFRLVLVKRDDQQFEVATFRREVRPEDFPEGDQPFGDNVFGTPEEDARRRDFTINALFYDPVSEKLIDYVNGLPDIESRTLRMIGEPDARLIEDPIRMLRGLRFSHKLGLTIEPTLRAAMAARASELPKSVLPRRREELLKILRLKDPAAALMEAFDLGLLMFATPTLNDFLSEPARANEFLIQLEALRSVVADPNDPVQLFAWLMYSMLQAARVCRAAAALEAGATRPPKADEISIEDEVFQRFMRDELGMYRFEQTVLTKAIGLLPLVAKTEEFKRRGERRQLAFMKNEGFKLAMQIAVADYLLSPAQLAFWSAALDRMSGELMVAEAEAKGKRRRRPRKPRKERGSSEGQKRTAEASDEGDPESDSDSDIDSDVDSDADGDSDDDFSDIKLSDVEDSGSKRADH